MLRDLSRAFDCTLELNGLDYCAKEKLIAPTMFSRVFKHTKRAEYMFRAGVEALCATNVAAERFATCEEERSTGWLLKQCEKDENFRSRLLRDTMPWMEAEKAKQGCD